MSFADALVQFLVACRAEPAEPYAVDAARVALLREAPDPTTLAVGAEVLVPTLSNPHPDVAVIAAVTIGALVEWGAPVEPVGAAVLVAVRRVLLGATAPQSLESACTPLWAVLSRSVTLRQAVRHDRPLRSRLAALAGTVGAARWVDLLLRGLDEDLVVIDMRLGRGFRLRARAVMDTPQLLTLLTAALAANGLPYPGPSPEAVAAARGLADVEQAVVASFQLLAWPAAGGFRHGIFPDQPVDAIPRLDGELVVVVGPLDAPSGWQVGYHEPGGSLEVVAELDAAEVRRRIAAMAVAAVRRPAAAPAPTR
jgi:hypothetical protein